MADKTRNSNSRLSEVEKAEQARKTKIWEMRLSLIKRGQQAMQQKQYGEAVVSYEKYIRILEIVFNVEPGNLNPEVFKENSRTSEMSILASAYWNLVRIYDTSPQYSDRQAKFAAQLAQFAPLTPLFNKIVTEAQEFAKNARHPQNVKIFLSAVGKASRCFIASSAYQSPVHPDVMILRNYRDSVLKQSFLGRKSIYFYYHCSPKIACILDRHSCLKAPTRWALKILIKCVR